MQARLVRGEDYREGRAPVAKWEHDPILSLRGLGKEIWAGLGTRMPAYVNELRSGFEELI